MSSIPVLADRRHFWFFVAGCMAVTTGVLMHLPMYLMGRGNGYRLADMRYRGGVDSYLGALIAQRDMYDAQRALIVTRLAGAENLVQLYQSLGGGWKE